MIKCFCSLAGPLPSPLPEGEGTLNAFIDYETMLAKEVIEKFKTSGALLEGHFILSSGLHSPLYLQCAIALEATTFAAEFGAAIADEFRGEQIETVASPAIGGIVIGYEVARQLGVRFIWAERENGRMTLRRGFQVSQRRARAGGRRRDYNGRLDARNDCCPDRRRRTGRRGRFDH